MTTACFLPLPLRVVVVLRIWGFVYRGWVVILCFPQLSYCWVMLGLGKRALGLLSKVLIS